MTSVFPSLPGTPRTLHLHLAVCVGHGCPDASTPSGYANFQGPGDFRTDRLERDVDQRNATGLDHAVGIGTDGKVPGRFFPSLPGPFKSVLRITITSTGLSVAGLRTRTNERQDFLITTIPATNENNLGTTSQMFLPQMADRGGYTSQFIVFGGIAGQLPSGEVKFVKQDGTSFTLALKSNSPDGR